MSIKQVYCILCSDEGTLVGCPNCHKFLQPPARCSDPVNQPQHYPSGDIECIDAIRASMSKEAFCGFLKGNMQKYMWRYEKKVNPVEDIKKARWYAERLIKELENV